MLKVSIVGCGKIADDHASQIRRIKGCEIVGVCDREPLMAQQLAERFGVRRYFGDLTDLLSEAKPDVVHITTPPQSHFDIAKLCLESGCHVYVEKPFTLCEEQAEKLIALAEERGLKMTAGHDDQFRPAARRMRSLLQEGFLGAGPVHMESYYCYELGQSDYAGALLSDKGHWVRRLPGKLLQNIISIFDFTKRNVLMELGTHCRTSKRSSSFPGKSSTRTIHSSCILLLSNFLRGDASCSAIFSIGNYQWISNFANISKRIEPTNFTDNPHPVSCYDFRNHRLGTDEIR